MGTLRCNEIMRHSVTVAVPTDTVLTAARAMRDASIAFLPIVDPEGRPVGIVTARDLAVRVLANEMPPTTPLEVVMTKNALACRVEDEVTQAEALMRQHRVTRILVTGERDELVGVLSLSDLAQYEPTSTVGRIVRSVSQRKYAPERP